MTRALLLVDVDSASASSLFGWCARFGYEPIEVRRVPPAELSGGHVAAAVIHLHEESRAALDRLRLFAKMLRGVPVLVVARGLSSVTGFELASLGVTALVDPPVDPSELTTRVAALVGAQSRPPEMADLIGESAVIRELRLQVERAARVDARVLLQGETGSGKGVAARAIHALSRRRAEPFVHVDCAALSPTLIESELFGHERGAFTGAENRRVGRFEAAARGTIFLDEIGDLDLALQAKLLRVLEERVFERVGGGQPIAMSARVIAATHHDLFEQVKQRRFRPDLYYRLSVLTIEVPPLRERLDDIPALVHDLVAKLSARHEVAPPRVDDSFLARLASHDWPGNVRELVNVIERVVAAADRREIDAADAERHLLRRSGAPQAPTVVDERPSLSDDAAGLERALRETGGNVLRAARRLGMSRSAVRHRIAKYGLAHLTERD